MFSTWRSRLQSFLGDDDVRRRQAAAKPESVARGSDILLLRTLLAYLEDRQSAATSCDEAVPNAPVQPATAGLPETAALADTPPEASSPAAVSAADFERADETLAVGRRFIAEQRKTAEALLREIANLEERFAIQAKAAQAARAYAAAKEQADAAVILAQEAKEQAQSACANRRASAAQRKDADELVAESRADAQTSKAQVTELEQKVRHARQVAAEIASELDQREARAEQCAKKESEATANEARAEERVAASQVALLKAQHEALAAKDRAQALKRESLAAGPSAAGIGDVQSLARRIAEAASALTPDSSAGWN